jgi:hypothetical protein
MNSRLRQADSTELADLLRRGQALVIGFIVHATGSFVGALAYIASVGLLGVISYIFILGDVRRIEL